MIGITLRCDTLPRVDDADGFDVLIDTPDESSNFKVFVRHTGHPLEAMAYACKVALNEFRHGARGIVIRTCWYMDY